MPVYAQMLNAVEEFFPKSGIMQDDGVAADELPRDSNGYPLRRVTTGMSELVGHNNGGRPGGFVLVIDGAALGHVRTKISRAWESVGLTCGSRLWLTRRTSTCCCDSRCSARASSAVVSPPSRKLSWSNLSRKAWAR